MNPIENKVFDLSNRAYDQVINKTQFAELEELLKESSEARSIYLKTIDLHFDIDHHALLGRLNTSSSDKLSCEKLLTEMDDLESDHPKPKKSITPWKIFMASAASFLIAILWLTGKFSFEEHTLFANEVLIVSRSGPFAANTFEVGDKMTSNHDILLNQQQSLKLRCYDNTILEITGPVLANFEKLHEQGQSLFLKNMTQEEQGSIDIPLRIKSDRTEICLANSRDDTSKGQLKVTETHNTFAVQFNRSFADIHVFKGEVKTYALVNKKNQEGQTITMLQAATFKKNGLVSKWIKPNYDHFKVEKHLSGVSHLSQNVRMLDHQPNSLEYGQLERNQSISLIIEKKAVVLEKKLDVTFLVGERGKSGGTRSAFQNHRKVIPKGTVVDSYLLHYDPSSSQALRGSISFHRTIIAVIARSDQLNASDSRFKHDHTKYPETQFRGMDGNRAEEHVDTFFYVGDPKGISVNLNIETESVDQIRIIVEAE